MSEFFSNESIIAGLVILGFSLLAYLVNKGIYVIFKKRLQKEPPDSQVFFIPPFFNGALMIVVLLLIPLEILLPIAWLNQSATGITIEIGLLIPAMMLPFLLIALLSIRHNSGAVVISGQKLIRYTLFGKKTLSLSQIERINVKAFGIPATVAVKGGGKKIRFPRAVQNYPQLLKQLQEATQLSTQNKQRTSSGIRMPHTIGISQGRMTLEVVSMMILVLIYLGISLIPLWSLLWQGKAPPFNQNNLLTIGIFFGLVSLIFIPLLVLVGIKSFGKKALIKIVLYQDRIQFHHSGGKIKTYLASDLEKVWLRPVQANIRSSYGGLRVRGTTTNYALMLRFASELEDIEIDANRLTTFKITPEAALETFEMAYPRMNDLP